MQALPGKKAVAFRMAVVCGKMPVFSSPQRDSPLHHHGRSVKLRDAHGAKEERDEASAALHFSYQEDGHSYEVWYADRGDP